STLQNPSHTYNTPGIYTVTLTATNSGGSSAPETKVDYVTVTDPPPSALYLSLASNAIVGGVNAADEDILWYDGTAWSLLFDGSDLGVSGDLNAFHVIDATQILMSFTKANTFGGVTIDDHDIALFTATSLGENTTGTFSLYFDGDTADLTAPAEDIDAVHLHADGRLIVSTLGTPSVSGVGSTKDEDLLAFTPTVPGDYTSGGTWEMYFDASDVGISGGGDVIGVSIAANGDIYLSTDTTVVVGGLTAADEDVFICTPITLGSTTQCTFAPGLYFDGSDWALEANDVDGIAVP
ncbi:MAG: PKD domain-containing protein, partial [Acidimicrobiia bacterium]|nr:PKD domain-containing protein [Acidimicrobiia bacterium]